MASWTTPDDVINAWIGEGKPTDEDLVQVWIDKAEREVRRRVPDIQARIDAQGAEDPARTDLLEAAVDVTVAMVTRIFRNPEGYRQKQWTTGPFSGSGTVGGDNPGTLYLTDDELATLAASTSRQAYTIDLIPPTSPYYSGPAT